MKIISNIIATIFENIRESNILAFLLVIVPIFFGTITNLTDQDDGNEILDNIQRIEQSTMNLIYIVIGIGSITTIFCVSWNIYRSVK